MVKDYLQRIDEAGGVCVCICVSVVCICICVYIDEAVGVCICIVCAHCRGWRCVCMDLCVFTLER